MPHHLQHLQTNSPDKSPVNMNENQEQGRMPELCKCLVFALKLIFRFLSIRYYNAPEDIAIDNQLTLE